MSSNINIVYIHSHDTGRYIEPYGHAVSSPRLQAFAEQGITFRQCFCAHPTCSPSRASLLTGQYPSTSGMLGLAHRGFELNDYKQHIIHTLRQHGYKSYLAGVQHIDNNQKDPLDWGTQIGYDEILDREDRKINAWHCEAERHAVDFLNRDHPEPFFLSVGFAETHRGFGEASSDEEPRWLCPPPGVVDRECTREEWAAFRTKLLHLDKKIGLVLDAIEANQLSENTLVICTTDHGIPYPNKKCNLNDEGLSVFLMMRGPKGFTGGKVLDSMVSHMDLFPTICEVLNIPIPQWLQGRSLMPLIKEEQKDIHDELFFQVNYHAAYEPMRAVRTDRWKYIQRFDELDPILPNVDGDVSRDMLKETGWTTRCHDREALYDLWADPMEGNNLIAHPNTSEISQALKSKLHAWMQDIDDPLLEGPIPLPTGGIVQKDNRFPPV